MLRGVVLSLMSIIFPSTQTVDQATLAAQAILKTSSKLNISLRILPVISFGLMERPSKWIDSKPSNAGCFI